MTLRIAKTLVATAAAGSVLLSGWMATAHSVGQIQTAKRISQQTVVLLDPQGNPGMGGVGTDTTAQVGDILTFVFQFTPVPNGASRGAGGYITEYIPPNTEVVGARIIDALGNTIAPQRGPQMDDGWGPRGRHGEFDGLGLAQGSLSQVYADTGIFYSTDALTARNPANAFITVFNGLEMTPKPTGVGGLEDLLGTNGSAYAHNEWDRFQAYAYGIDGGVVVQDGKGNTPFMYGSAVAGPQTHYQFQKVPTPACSDGMNNDADALTDYPDDPECASALDDDETAASDGPVGPWNRIRYAGSEIAVGVATDCESCAGDYVRVGTPTDLGWDLSADNPLPSNANAVRFAVGELIVGQEYFAEISLRVTALPLDPTMAADVNCSEVFGGDAAMPQKGQDNTWRYFLPGPACVQLNLFFELDVDKLIALSGDTLTYTIDGKNLSTNTMTNVVITDTFVDGDVSFVQSLVGPAPTVGNGTLTWPAMTLMPGDAYQFVWEMQVDGNDKSTINRATYTSDQLPSPGFSVAALTNIEALAVLSQDVVVNPTSTSAGQNVQYTATITNNGTGVTDVNGASFIEVTLPAGFTFCGVGDGCTQPTINTAGVADPAGGPNNTIVFTDGLVPIAANGGTLVLVFDVTVDAGVAADQYTVDVQTTVDDPGVNKDVEISVFGVAPLLVDTVQSDPPVLDDPVLAGATVVTGVTSEGIGATVTVAVNGNTVNPVVAQAGGIFSVIVPTLYAGQHLNATAQTAGEIESDWSSPDVIVAAVGGTTQCNDRIDNDGDNLVDYPDDPGCTDALDLDETDVPECSDGIDNDTDNLVDFPDDPSCSSYLDDDESGPPACSDGVDNDGDTLVDFPDDPGCQDANDINEDDIAACANGLDDDGDTLIDYPNDPGCSDVYDDDETDATGTGGSGGAGGGSGGAMGTGGGAMGAGGVGNGVPPDLGGLGLDVASGDDSGCGCRVAGERVPGGPWWLLLAATLTGLARRCRRRS